MLRPIFLTVLVKKLDDSKNNTYLEKRWRTCAQKDQYKSTMLFMSRADLSDSCYKHIT